MFYTESPQSKKKTFRLYTLVTITVVGLLVYSIEKSKKQNIFMIDNPQEPKYQSVYNWDLPS